MPVGFSALDYIKTLKTLIEQTTNIHLAFVDYREAFYFIEICAILKALNNAIIDSRYSQLIKSIYKDATLHVERDIDLQTSTVSIEKGYGGCLQADELRG